MKIRITDKAYRGLMAAGISEFDIQMLIDKVSSMPKRGWPVDASDDISCKDVKLSFMRHHGTDKAIIMLLSEADAVDKVVDMMVANGEISIMAQ